MHTSVAPISHASWARRTTSSTGRKYPSSSRWSRLNAQKVQCLMQTLVKFTLRLTTNVTTSPACRRRISSATAPSAARSRPRTSARPSASSTEISWSSSARPSARRTWGEAHANRNSWLPASPVLMALLDEARSVDERADAGPQRFGDEFGPPREFGIDGEALAEVEALALGGATEIGDERPRPLGIDVIE